MGFTIKQVSEITGFPPSTLRYYEKVKMLPPVNRNSIGIRVYNDDDIEWISVINCLKNTNMPINNIKKFVALCAQGDSTLKERLQMVMGHQEDIKSQIAELQAYQKHIDFKVEYYKKACEAGAEDTVKYLYKTRKITK
jgi:DNA-binding transcriptional MerR regulator